MARILLENVRNWIASDEDEIFHMGLDMRPGPSLTPERIEEMAKSGAGAFGHTTIIEPADLDLYESYMYPPLRMPEKPQVMVSYWDMNQTPVNFIEGRVMVKTLCPDGFESWLVIWVPVPNFHTALEGNCWGWPKYVADEMTVERERSEVIYEGKVSLSMDFTPGGVDEATIRQLKENGTEGGNTVSFHIDGGRHVFDEAGAWRRSRTSRDPFCRVGAGHDQDPHTARGPLFWPVTTRLCYPGRLSEVFRHRRWRRRDVQVEVRVNRNGAFGE